MTIVIEAGLREEQQKVAELLGRIEPCLSGYPRGVIILMSIRLIADPAKDPG